MRTVLATLVAIVAALAGPGYAQAISCPLGYSYSLKSAAVSTQTIFQSSTKSTNDALTSTSDHNVGSIGVANFGNATYIELGVVQGYTLGYYFPTLHRFLYEKYSGGYIFEDWGAVGEGVPTTFEIRRTAGTSNFRGYVNGTAAGTVLTIPGYDHFQAQGEDYNSDGTCENHDVYHSTNIDLTSSRSDSPWSVVYCTTATKKVIEAWRSDNARVWCPTGPQLASLAVDPFASFVEPFTLPSDRPPGGTFVVRSAIP